MSAWKGLAYKVCVILSTVYFFISLIDPDLTSADWPAIPFVNSWNCIDYKVYVWFKKYNHPYAPFGSQYLYI